MKQICGKQIHSLTKKTNGRVKARAICENERKDLYITVQIQDKNNAFLE